ncbi:MAG: zf-HC2 domain-containing protein [Gemmatimonadota bacterium]
MGHAAEGSLQAYVDGEIDGAERSRLSEHFSACAACATELAALQRSSDVAHEALVLLDVEPSLGRARVALAGVAAPARHSGRFLLLGLSSFSRAAVLLLAVAGAGAAAIPGSPVRRALEATLDRVAELFGGAPETVHTPVPIVPAAAEPEVDRQWAAIAPADGSVRVLLHGTSGDVDVTVRLTADDRANVETLIRDGSVRFVSGSGRLEVLGLGTGTVVIELPRTLQSAAIEANGEVHVYKQGDQLRLSGPAGDGEGSEVRFRIGS